MSPTLTLSLLLPGIGTPGKPHKTLATTDTDNSSFAALLLLDGNALPPVPLPLPLPDTAALPLPLSQEPGDTGGEGTALPSAIPRSQHTTHPHLPTAFAAQPAPPVKITPPTGTSHPVLPETPHAAPVHAPSLPAGVPSAPLPQPAPANAVAVPVPMALPQRPDPPPAPPPEIPTPFIPTSHAAPDTLPPTSDSTLQAPDTPDEPHITFWAQPALRSAELTLDADGHAVQVKVALSGSQSNEAHVTLLTDHAAERQALHGETEQLRDMLQEEGLHLAAVTVGSGERQQPRQPHAHHWPSDDKQRATLPTETENAALVQPRIASDGSLDVFV